MALTLAAISNSWGIDNTSTLNFIQSLGNYDGFTAPCPLPQYIWANHYGWDLFYSAILGVMYPQYYNAFNFPYDFCKAQAILDAAPSDGPFAHSASDSNANGWAAVRRFIDSPPEQTYGETSASNDWAGNYNGLDYMLFYNLYYLISEKVVNPPSLIPYTTIYSTIPAIYPCGVDCGDYSDPAIDIFPCSQIVVNYLDVKGGIAGGGNLQLQGGPSGILLNPVSSPYTPANMSPLTIHIENGGLFKATVNSDCSSSCYPLYSSYINEYNTPSLDYARMSSGNDSSSTLPSYKMNNEFASLPNSNAIMSYPNPAIDEITVEFALKNNTPISMYLCDANGNRLKNIFENTLYSRGLYVIKCSLSNINAGTYFCVLLTKDDKKTTKIIKIN